jgi:hypothetical protein
MSEKAFDKLLKDTFLRPELPYTDQDYLDMKKQLDAAREKKSNRKIWLFITAAAACMLIVIAISALTKYTYTTQPELAVKPTTTTPRVHAITQTASALTETNTQAERISRQDASVTKTSKHTNAFLSNNSNNINRPIPFTPNSSITDNSIKAQLPEAISATHTEQKEKPSIVLKANTAEVKDHGWGPSAAEKTPTQLLSDFSTTNTHHPINLSVAGGVNYGAYSQGFLLGAAFNKNLNDKFYVEGDIAFAQSSNTRTITTYSASPPPYTGTGFITQVPTGVTKDNSSNYNYLQFNPLLGYKLFKKLSLGVGPDLQRLLQSNTQSTAANVFSTGMASETGKIIPDMDYGLMGKTEYSFTSRLLAALQYRQGLTNFINNSSRYLDRNYVQIQVKYRLFNK